MKSIAIIGWEVPVEVEYSLNDPDSVIIERMDAAIKEAASKIDWRNAILLRVEKVELDSNRN
jgi:hypothetical protein